MEHNESINKFLNQQQHQLHFLMASNTKIYTNNTTKALLLKTTAFFGTRNIIFGTLAIGQNDPEIPNLEFENHGFLENQVFLPTEQAGTNLS